MKKPIELQTTIIHREKPIIVEQPIITEKHEHYRDQTEIIRDNNMNNLPNNNNQNYLNEQDAINNLKQQRLQQYENNGNSPIIKNEQQHVQLNPQVQQQPTQVYENQIIYEQPIEIEQKHIEHVMPKINENIHLQQNHIYEKNEPQIITNNPQFQNVNNMPQNNNQNNNSLRGNEEFLLTIVSAQGLKKDDLLSKSDPYVVIKSGNQKFKTKTVKNTQTPTWNEQFRISLTNDVELLLMDDDILVDDKMGRAVISRNQLMQGQEDINLPILMKGKAAGTFHIRLRSLNGQQSGQLGQSNQSSQVLNNDNSNQRRGQAISQ